MLLDKIEDLLNLRHIEGRQAPHIDAVPDAAHTKRWRVIIRQPGKSVSNLKHVDISERESQESASLPKFVVPS